LLLTPLELLEALASRLLTSAWKALANAIRRDILDLLATGPQTTSDLSEALPDLSRFAIMRHLKLLEEADVDLPEWDSKWYDHEYGKAEDDNYGGAPEGR
jgi:DNA-binding transcriptional ArsR family regulator